MRVYERPHLRKKKNSCEKFNFSSETDHRAHVLKS